MLVKVRVFKSVPATKSTRETFPHQGVHRHHYRHRRLVKRAMKPVSGASSGEQIVRVFSF